MHETLCSLMITCTLPLRHFIVSYHVPDGTGEEQAGVRTWAAPPDCTADIQEAHDQESSPLLSVLPAPLGVLWVGHQKRAHQWGKWNEKVWDSGHKVTSELPAWVSGRRGREVGKQWNGAEKHPREGEDGDGPFWRNQWASVALSVVQAVFRPIRIFKNRQAVGVVFFVSFFLLVTLAFPEKLRNRKTSRAVHPVPKKS